MVRQSATFTSKQWIEQAIEFQILDINDQIVLIDNSSVLKIYSETTGFAVTGDTIVQSSNGIFLFDNLMFQGIVLFPLMNRLPKQRIQYNTGSGQHRPLNLFCIDRGGVPIP